MDPVRRHAPDLNASSRSTALEQMKNERVDILVVGGGITGVGAALDAAARGLRVGLIEQDDLGSGTSSKSSKLIHGGIRYLEQLNFSLVREALRERRLLLTEIAPHLVRPVPFLLPLRHRIWERLYLGAGVALYDRLGGSRFVPGARHLSRGATRRMAPGLTGAYVGGVQFWDAQTDDARYVICAARTAAAFGAQIATRVRADELVFEGGRARGARITDIETGESTIFRARHVIVASGPWSGALTNGLGESTLRVRPSKGVHVLLPRESLDLETGVLARTRTGLLFIIPWEGQWLIGDTDTDWDGDVSHVIAHREDVAVLVGRLNEVLSAQIDTRQIVGVFAGLRPLIAADPDADSVALSREHAIDSSHPGVSVISGGKFTTYRAMAAQVIDAAIRDLGDAAVGTSLTSRIPLVGAESVDELKAQSHDLSASAGIEPERLERLLERYGSCAIDLLSLITHEPSLARVLGDTDVLEAEVVYACTHEGAAHVSDVLERRTRISIQSRDRGLSVLEEVLTLMGRILGWDARQLGAERDLYRLSAEREGRTLAE